MKNTIIIDSNHICHKYKYSLEDLDYNEQKTGIIFGFLKDILVIADKFQTNRIVFAWDSKKSKRREIFPDYKKKRKELTEEQKELNKIAYPQFDIIRRNILPKLRFQNNFLKRGYEGDDIIGSIVKNNSGNFVVVTNDNDMYCLISENVIVYDKYKNKKYDLKSFQKEFGISPKKWEDVKAFAGCKGDEVPGIDRIGVPTAIKYLNDELPLHYKSFQKIESDEGQKQSNWTRKLIRVPLEGTPEIKLKPFERLDFGNFLDVCGIYGLNSFIKGKESSIFQKIFC